MTALGRARLALPGLILAIGLLITTVASAFEMLRGGGSPQGSAAPHGWQSGKVMYLAKGGGGGG
ncbi:MAG TPA: hypothetical protein VJX92_24210, partial [Methylomirabilota bacterium]|nr:hypothetical protein [Methylomirabilota bacterium]